MKMTVEDFLSKSRFCSEDISVLIKIIRRQQAALKNLKTHMEVVTGPSYWSSSAWRIASESLADCDAIVEGK